MVIFFLIVEFAMTISLSYTAYRYGRAKEAAMRVGALANILRKSPVKQMDKPQTPEQHIEWLLEQMKTYQQCMDVMVDDKKLVANYHEYEQFKLENPLYGIKRNNGVDGKPRETNRA